MRVAAPPVRESFAWARPLAAKAPPVFADARIQQFLWGRPGHTPPGEKAILPCNPFFQQIVRHLRQLGCAVQVLQLNNKGRRLGRGRSVFPYANSPTEWTHLPDRRQRPVSSACVNWGGGHFYLFLLLDENDVLLTYRQNLSAWSDDDCNQFLRTALEVNCNWQSVGETLSLTTGRQHTVRVFQDEQPQRLAHQYHSFLKFAIANYNKHIAINSACSRIHSASLSPSDLLIDHYNQVNTIIRSCEKNHYPGTTIGEEPIIEV